MLLLRSILLLLSCTFLFACANRTSLDSGSARNENGDLTTSSDEPEARKRARIRLELASGYFSEGKHTFALDQVKLAINNDPDYQEAYNLRGLIYARLNEPSLADESFRKALTLKPRDPDTLHNYAWTLCQRGRYAESYVLFAQAIGNESYSSPVKSWLAQGLCQMTAKDLENAERSLMRAYELEASNPVTGYNLAKLILQKNDPKRAQFYIRRVNNSEFANAETIWLGLKIDRQLGQLEGAGQLANQLKSRYPQSPQVQLLDREAFNE